MKNFDKKKFFQENSLKNIMEIYIDEFFDIMDGYKNQDGLYNLIIPEIEKIMIKKALKKTDNNKIKASEFLGINRNTLLNKIKKFKLENDI